jgi:hypothetical protein
METELLNEEESLHYFLNKTKTSSMRIIMKPGAVAHSCNPSYSGGRDLEDGGFRQEVSKPSTQSITLCVVVYACHPRYIRSISRKVTVQAYLGKNLRPYLKNN